MRPALTLAALVLSAVGAGLLVGPALSDAISAAVAATVFGF